MNMGESDEIEDMTRSTACAAELNRRRKHHILDEHHLNIDELSLKLKAILSKGNFLEENPLLHVKYFSCIQHPQDMSL